MNGESHLRWNPLAVLGRWRQLFWLTPLAALLTALIWHLLDSRREGAAGVVDLGPSGQSAAFIALVGSPEFMAAVAAETGQSQGQLGSLIHCNPVAGTTLVRIEVREVPGMDAATLCDVILHKSVERFSRQSGPVLIRDAASWQSTPWSERLHSFRGNAGFVFWSSLSLALGLAYLAEALEPRRPGSGRSHRHHLKHL